MCSDIPEISGGLPLLDALLHKLGLRGVAKGVRREVAFRQIEVSQLDGGRHAVLHAHDRLAVPFDEMAR